MKKKRKKCQYSAGSPKATPTRYNLDRLQRGQQTRKAWLGAYLDCIIPIRFSVRGANKGATEYGGSMSDQLTVFSRGAFVMVCKG